MFLCTCQLLRRKHRSSQSGKFGSCDYLGVAARVVTLSFKFHTTMISTEGLKDDRSGCKYCLITVEKMLVALGVMVSFTVPWTFGEAY
jgi:hypothetical protein